MSGSVSMSGVSVSARWSPTTSRCAVGWATALAVQERALRAFARHLDRAGHRGPIPLETSLDWASATASPDPCNPARRLGMVRGFLRHLSAIDGETEVPAPGLLGPAGHRTPPHVYSDREIAELLQAATGLAPAGGLRPHCYAVLLGLIACTGLRISEALALTCDDVDLAQGVLTVRAGKRGRTRVVPLHPSALDPLRGYAQDRARRFGPPRRGCGVLPHRPQRPDRLQRGQPRLSAAAPPAGLDRGRAHPHATRARPAPPHGGPPHPVLARPGCRRRQQDPGVGDLPRARRGARALLVPVRGARTDEHRRPAVRTLRRPRPGRRAMRAPQIGFAQLVQDFFLRRLVAQRGASARTVEAYRDAFELLLGFAEQRTGKPPSALALADLDAPLVLDFLDHLETERGNSVRTRNARLAAIHSFMRYAALRDPTGLPITARVLAIPAKRFDRPVLGYLSREQIAAILAAPDRTTWSGRRDAVLLATAYNTGARVSELTHLQVRDVLLDRQCAVHLHGKGRKQRAIPLWKNTADELRGWLGQINSAPEAPVFPNRAGAPLTRSGVRDRLDRAVAIAAQRCPSLHGQRVTPHTLRHSTAMHLLQSGTDLAVIALWLGHESPATTHQYLEADLAAKEAVLRRLDDPHQSSPRFHPGDRLLAFLQGL